MAGNRQALLVGVHDEWMDGYYQAHAWGGYSWAYDSPLLGPHDSRPFFSFTFWVWNRGEDQRGE